MFNKSIFITVILLFSGITLYGGTARFRSGTVTAAEITTSRLNIDQIDWRVFPNAPDNKAYAVISVKLDPHRALSIFDYSLFVNGNPCKCIAILRNGKFKYFTDTWFSPDQVTQMVFLIDAKKLPVAQKKSDVIMRSNLNDPIGHFDCTVRATVIGTRTPTPISRIPSNGLLETE